MLALSTILAVLDGQTERLKAQLNLNGQSHAVVIFICMNFECTFVHIQSGYIFSKIKMNTIHLRKANRYATLINRSICLG
jgi:hypothetical protein